MSEFCTDPANHVKHMRFCGGCADIGQVEVILCAKCNNKKHSQHSTTHSDYMVLAQEKFVHHIESFINYIQFYRVELQNLQHENLRIILQSKSQDFSYELFQNDSFRNWMIKCKFWNFSNNTNIQQAISRVKEIARSQVSIQPTQQVRPIDDLQNQFRICINWGSEYARQVEEVAAMLETSEKQMDTIQIQKYNSDIMIRVFSTCTESEISQTLNFINDQLQKKPQNSILYLSKLHLMELYEGNYNIWGSILKSINDCDIQFKNSPTYTFYQSFKFWRKLTIGEISNLKKNKKKDFIYVINSWSKNYYTLTNAEQFVNLLSTALIHQNCPKNGVFYSLRAVGYLYLKKYNEAKRSFTEALNEFKQCDSALSNLNFIKTVQQNILKEDIFIKRVQMTKSRDFLVNGIKYYKTINQPQNILQCCEALLKIDQQNQFSRLELIKALLKMQDLDSAKKNRKQLKNLSEDKLRELDRKILYTQATLLTKKQLNSCEPLRILVQKKQTASACYSYASALYNSQNYNQASIWIDKAILLKNNKPKYKKLKFYICLFKREFEQACQISKDLKEPADDEILEFLKEQLEQ